MKFTPEDFVWRCLESKDCLPGDIADIANAKIKGLLQDSRTVYGKLSDLGNFVPHGLNRGKADTHKAKLVQIEEIDRCLCNEINARNCPVHQ